MKKLVLLSLAIGLSFLSLAQAPQLINYQAVIRNATGQVVQNQNVSLRLSIHEKYSVGINVYQEEHMVTTNDFGLVNIHIGAGVNKTGLLNDVKWGSEVHILKVSLDLNGGSTYEIMGYAQLVSVPYALHANTADSIVGGVTGLKGDKGDAGAQGIQGLKGDTGAVGPQGIIGLTGLTGAQGIQGLKGDTGGVGPQGIIGLTGAQGIQGLKGDTGVAGIQGIQGIQGLKGDTGAVGPLVAGIASQTLRHNGTTWVATSNLSNNDTTVTTTADMNINGLTVGRGAGSIGGPFPGTNTALGYQALNANTSGFLNTAVGYQALYNNTTGIINIAIGQKALYNNTTGSENIATRQDLI